MSEYEKSKTPRRVAAVVYLLVMMFVLGGTYLSQRQKQMADNVDASNPQATNMPY
ncbi:hypothetical protein [Crenothrix sp.]|jgi:uncharacterized protein YneF (UPF0154 family)|uniref:hypothetical protein n=1 Tax=Crenothrix sp. TaxID=3100433 RepID=UPI00374CE6F0